MVTQVFERQGASDEIAPTHERGIAADETALLREQPILTDGRAPVRPAVIKTNGSGGDLEPRVLGELAAIFSALGEPTRLRIVNALAHSELCVGDIAAALGLAVPAVSQQLRVLRDLRIVRNRRAGKLVYYALDDAHVFDLFTVALAHVRRETMQ